MDTRFQLSGTLALRSSLESALSPHIQLLLKILQMGHIELDTYVDQAVLENPLLTRDDPKDVEDNVLPHHSLPSRVSTSQVDLCDTLAAPTASLRDVLFQQLSNKLHAPQDQRCFDALVDELDERGLFTGNVDTLATALGVKPQRLESVLYHIQTCDPVGIGARTLGECFQRQLEDRGECTDIDRRLLPHVMELIAGNPQRLLKHLGVTHEDFRTTLQKLRTLNPEPAAAFRHIPPSHHEPDILVEARADGLKVRVNPRVIPNLLIDQSYCADVKHQCRTGRDRAYLTERMQHARGLLQALHQRTNTLLKVATAIVEQQQAYLMFGSEGLRPLTLKDIAQATNLHESTISRVTQNKTMLTPQGIKAFRTFFSSSVSSAFHSEGVASRHAKGLIQELIARESHKPLSDDQIVVQLKDRGIVLARRTVAKYREALGIPSSSERRKTLTLKNLVATMHSRPAQLEMPNQGLIER